MKKMLALFLTLVLVLGMVSACAKPADIDYVPPDPDPNDPGTSAQPADPGSDGPSRPVTTDDPIIEPDPQPQVAGVTTLSAYEELYDKLELTYTGGFGGGSDIVFDDALMGDAVVEAPEAEGSTSADSAAGESTGTVNGDYSETNVQVEGVDEADIVKTDGEYIYVLRDSGWLTILSADGEASAQLSNTQVCFEEESKTETSYEYLYEYAENLYLSGDRIVVLYTYNHWGYGEADDAYFDEYRQGARIYDVSDPTAPALVADIGQDGWLTDSRMMDGVLYLLTNYHVYAHFGIEREQPETYIPRTYCDGTAALMAADCIYLPEPVESSSYLVMQAVDVATGEKLSELAVLGRSGYVYMNRSNLFVAGTRYEETVGEPYTEEVYTVTEHTEQRVTNILRFAVDGGTVTLEATGTVPGSPLNQYSFDEYNGHLRIVTTEYSNTYCVYEDEQRDFVNYEWLDSGTSNSLYVLDEALQIVGSVTGLGEDERVYSVRFDGDVGYFVTFRETDPLFAVDLSDPAAPQVMSELKIPGFSSYLHVWNDGLLFGLGQMADEETGATEGLKLAMYDISDPYDVTELLMQPVGADYSPAQNNPRAVCIDPAKNLIGFACEDYSGWDGSMFYVLYRYVDGAFVELGRWELNDWIYNTRGLYVGSEFYIVGESELIVVSLETGAELARILIPYG